MNCADFLFEKSSGTVTDFIVGGMQKISHRALFTLVQTLAADIARRFGSGKAILLLSENCLFFIVAYLSIIKSGNRAVLVETNLSAEQLEAIVVTCSPVAFFVQEKQVSKLRVTENLFSEQYINNPPKDMRTVNLPPDEDEVAVIIFTSGSTGEKKGVMLTHKNIRTNTESIVEYLKLTARDRMLVVLPFFYCYGLSLLHTHLRVGGSLVLHQSPFLGSAIKEIKNYSVESHFKYGWKTWWIYDDLRKIILDLDSRFEENPQKYYIGFKIEKANVLSFRIRKQKLVLVLGRVRPQDLNDPEKRTYYEKNSFKYYNQHLTDFDLLSREDVDYAVFLIKQVYEKFFK